MTLKHSVTEEPSGIKAPISAPSKTVIWYCKTFGGSFLHSYILYL